MTGEPNVRHVPISAWKLMPPAPDACQVCAVRHAPAEPHNPDSLYWQTARAIAGELTPTWEDALAHVDDATHERWRTELARHGVQVAAR